MKHLKNCLTNMQIGGEVGEILAENTRNWLQKLLIDDSGLFEGFATPEDDSIFRTMWHGEYPGKLMTGIAQSYYLQNEQAIYLLGERMVQEFARVQQSDGYLGPWKKEKQFEKDVWNEAVEFALDTPPERWGKWDTWGQYHCIIGLYRWYQLTGNQTALKVALRALDNIYDHFITGGISIARQNWAECNLAIGHAFALLYEETGDDRYLQAAKRIVHQDWQTVYPDFYTRKRLCCDWLTAALQGKPYFASGQPRWEGLYSLETLAVLERVTGEEIYSKALHALWNSMVRTDRHNTGSFGTGEGATGQLYGAGSETCNTVAWMAFSTDYLAFSRNSRVADELELSFYNATLGSLLKGERNFTYMNLSDGTREAANITLREQGYRGARDMSCCQSNGNRGLTQPTQWAVMADGNTVYLNYYGQTTLALRLEDGSNITLQQTTAYPRQGSVVITLHTEKPVACKLLLRIPAWSFQTTISLNGQDCTHPVCGQYAEFDRVWQDDDTLTLTLDMGLHGWLQQKEQQTTLSVYSGPVLLSAHSADLPAEDLTLAEIKAAEPVDGGDFAAYQIKRADGSRITLTDHRYAGKDGSAFCSWLPVRPDKPVTSPFEEMPWVTEI